MKVASLVSFFLVFAFAAKQLPRVISDVAPVPVLDITSKLLRTGIDHCILPVFRGRGGGFTMARTANKTCMPTQSCAKLVHTKGLPLIFTPVNPKKGVVLHYHKTCG